MLRILTAIALVFPAILPAYAGGSMANETKSIIHINTRAEQQRYDQHRQRLEQKIQRAQDNAERLWEKKEAARAEQRANDAMREYYDKKAADHRKSLYGKRK